MAIEVKVPDIGDFKDVPIIEVHVQAGARVKGEDPLITLESDKATMDVPAPQAGTVAEVKVAVGDRVGEGAVILLLEPEGAAAIPPKEKVKEGAAPGFRRARDLRLQCRRLRDHRGQGPRHRRLQGRAGDRGPCRRGGHGQGRGPAADPGVRQGHHGRAVAGRRHGHRPQGQGRRPGGRGHADPAPADRRREAGRRGSRVRRLHPRPSPPAAAKGDYHAEVLVLGAGPGGYSAAFRAADLGRQVVLVERWPTLGGVCLNVGCIPSKALLHAAKVIAESEEMGHFGVKFAAPTVDIDALRGWKDGVVKKLTGGLSGLAKARKVTVV